MYLSTWNMSSLQLLCLSTGSLGGLVHCVVWKTHLYWRAFGFASVRGLTKQISKGSELLQPQSVITTNQISDDLFLPCCSSAT